MKLLSLHVDLNQISNQFDFIKNLYIIVTSNKAFFFTVRYFVNLIVELRHFLEKL